MLNISQFLPLLLVVQSQSDAPQYFLINGAGQEPLYFVVNACSVIKDLIKRGAEKGSAQLLFRDLLFE